MEKEALVVNAKRPNVIFNIHNIGNIYNFLEYEFLGTIFNTMSHIDIPGERKSEYTYE